MNPYKEVEESSFTSSPHLSYEDIATKLLKDNFFLTALELHTELVESGKELPQLREFFSNPGNFEQHVSRASEFTSMHRSPSQATLDSLDTARYSEDGGGDRAGSGNDVAVLEFELRKARETIHALRANLTQFADGESALDKSIKDNFDQRSLKPHEKRALNFLINEYLLLQDYKLTSITFSDENPDQEFEDWDDVGLNMPRPANLISLFRGDSTGLCVRKLDAATDMEWQYLEVECQTEIDDGCRKTPDNDTDWDHEIHIQAAEIELLKQKIIALETEKLNFQTLYDAAIVSLNSLTTPTAEFKGLELNLPEGTLARIKEQENHDLRQEAMDRPLTCTATENHYGSGHSTHSGTPEQFEMIDSERNSGSTKKAGSHTSSIEPTIENISPSPLRRSVTTLDTLSINEEWTRVHCDYTSIETSKEMWIDSSLPINLKESLLNMCSETLNLNEPLSNDLLSELVTSEKPITMPGLLTLVADTLPRIIPHTLIARRCEAAALLAASAALLPPGDLRRAKTLHTLLTLVKKPEHADTRAICEAACLIVKWGGSGEVLSSVAELLASKSSERRLLASQICVAIAPYVSIEFCTSLLLSLVTLMCESSEGEIRSLGLKSACVICPVTEHKYGQLESIFFAFLKDPLERNVKDAVNVFAPVLARSALIAGKFSTDLLNRVIANLSKSQSEWKNIVLYLDVLRILVIAQLAYVVNVQIVRDTTSCDMILEEIPLDGERGFYLDLQCYVDDAKSLFAGMNVLIKENPDVRWEELEWFIKTIKQILDVAVNSKILNHTAIYESLLSLFSDYVNNFGVNFTSRILRQIFVEIISDLEGKMEKLHSLNVDDTVVVGIYLVTILPAVGNEAEHGEFMQKWIVYSSLRGLPVKLFTIPLKWVAKHKAEILDSYLHHLREFAASSCESPNGASVRVHIAELIAELLNIAEVNETSVEKQIMPAVVALLHDDDVTVREVAITAWGSVARTCVTRGLDCEAQCWPSVEDMMSSRPLVGKEASRLAEALALLVLPTADSRNVSEKAVSLICGMCHMDNLKADILSSLAPGLQLCAHHCRHHPALLPALRKLEEAVQTPSLSQFKPAIDALLHNMGSAGAELRELAAAPRTPANLLAAQEVGRRVTQMFQHSKTNMNLQSIFKKKT